MKREDRVSRWAYGLPLTVGFTPTVISTYNHRWGKTKPALGQTRNNQISG